VEWNGHYFGNPRKKMSELIIMLELKKKRNPRKKVKEKKGV